MSTPLAVPCLLSTPLAVPHDLSNPLAVPGTLCTRVNMTASCSTSSPWMQSIFSLSLFLRKHKSFYVQVVDNHFCLKKDCWHDTAILCHAHTNSKTSVAELCAVCVLSSSWTQFAVVFCLNTHHIPAPVCCMSTMMRI